MQEIRIVATDRGPLPHYFNGASYLRVPKKHLVLMAVKDAAPWPISNADIRAEIKRRWKIDMTSTHIRYHLKALLASNRVEQTGRGEYRAPTQQESIFE